MHAHAEMTRRDRELEELRREVKRLRQIEWTFHALMGKLPLGIVMADAQSGTIQMISSHGREQIRQPSKEIIGKGIEEHAGRWRRDRRDGTDSTGKAEFPLARAVKSGEVVESQEWFYSGPDGETPYLLSASPVTDKDGHITGGILAWKDVSESKEMEREIQALNDDLEARVRQRTAELQETKEELEKQKAFLFKILEALWESEEKYRTLFDNAADLIAVVDTQGNFLDLNRKFEEESGYSRAEMLGKNAFSCGILTEASVGKAKTRIQKLLEEGSSHLFEVEGVRKDGLKIQYELRAVPISKEGKIATVQAILRNISERKKTLEALRAYTERLELVNQELKDFASIASHDLQEPLRKVQAFADLLKTRYVDSLDEEGRFYLERMATAAARMSRLIRALLKYSRVVSKGQLFKKVDLNKLLQGVLSDLEFRVQEAKAVFEIGDLPTVKADPTQMGQVFQNLIVNALKFSKENPVVRISSRTHKDYVEIFVQDNGIGFDAGSAHRIFKPFQRLRSGSAYEGTGIGLAIVKRIVERHDGEITAQSSPGEGSTFIVKLPLRT